MWHLQTWRCVSSKVADLWSQVALRDQGFAIGSMSFHIEGAVDGPTQAEEGCCDFHVAMTNKNVRGLPGCCCYTTKRSNTIMHRGTKGECLLEYDDGC